jgi:hypothetical protein
MTYAELYISQAEEAIRAHPRWKPEFERFMPTPEVCYEDDWNRGLSAEDCAEEYIRVFYRIEERERFAAQAKANSLKAVQ